MDSGDSVRCGSERIRQVDADFTHLLIANRGRWHLKVLSGPRGGGIDQDALTPNPSPTRERGVLVGDRSRDSV